MGIAGKNVDRLLPRHESATNIDLTWNVRTARSGLFKQHKEELTDRAAIRDISLEGALVEVTGGAAHSVGDQVAVRFRGLDGDAVIRHCQTDEADVHRYGIRFLPDPTFNDALNAAVGELRGHSSELSQAWQQQN